jgi:hypothetical protein
MKHNAEFNTDLAPDENDSNIIIDETSEHFQILKQKHEKHRQFVLEQEKLKTDQDKKKQKEKQELMDQMNIEIRNKAYMKRRNQSAKYREIVHNEKIQKLITKVDFYLKRFSKEPLTTTEELKNKAVEEFMEEEAKKKAPQEKINSTVSRLFKLSNKDEEERKKNKEKIAEGKAKNLKAKTLVKKKAITITDKISNKDLSNVNGLFFEEDINNQATNSQPLVNFLPSIDKRAQSAKVNRVVINRENPDDELKKLVKNGCKMEDLMAFQKKYKFYDISNYLHKVKLQTIKNKTTIEKPVKRVFIEQELARQAETLLGKTKFDNVRGGGGDITSQNISENNVQNTNNKFNQFQEEELVADEASPEQRENEENEIPEGDNNNENCENYENEEAVRNDFDNLRTNKEPTAYSQSRKDDPSFSYLIACKYNNEEFIKAHLISAKDDDEMVIKVNERDEFGRKGILYLILHGNYDMIKLSLMSGIILGDCIDNYNRNIIHYCTLSPYNDIIDIICRCIIFEHKEQHNEMIKYLQKVYLGTKYNIESIPLEKEQVDDMLSTLDDSVTNKVKIYTAYEQEVPIDQIMFNSGFDKIEGINTLKPTTVGYNLFTKIVKRQKIPLMQMINMKDSDGRTPLHIAAMNNHFESIKVLCYYNVRLEDYDSENKVRLFNI